MARSLLGDDDVPPFIRTGREERKKSNFELLQDLGKKDASEDFGDSAFADRQPLKEEE